MKRKSEIGIYLILVVGIILSISVYYIVNSRSEERRVGKEC